MIENNLNNNGVSAHYHASGKGAFESFFEFLRDMFKSKKEKTLNKESLRILFIDDNKFPIIENLKKSGYVVEYLKDIKSIHNPKIIDANILFIDYKGIGKNLSQEKEGIGICRMLKDEYQDSKYIVLCTGESIPNTLIKEIKNISHEIIPKSSETIDFINVINKAKGLIELS